MKEPRHRWKEEGEWVQYPQRKNIPGAPQKTCFANKYVKYSRRMKKRWDTYLQIERVRWKLSLWQGKNQKECHIGMKYHIIRDRHYFKKYHLWIFRERGFLIKIKQERRREPQNRIFCIVHKIDWKFLLSWWPRKPQVRTVTAKCACQRVWLWNQVRHTILVGLWGYNLEELGIGERPCSRQKRTESPAGQVIQGLTDLLGLLWCLWVALNHSHLLRG